MDKTVGHYNENYHKIDLDDCFSTSSSNAVLKKEPLHAILLTKTIEYYEKECAESVKGKNEFVDPLKEVTCFTVDEVLSKEECSNIIKKTEKIGYQDLKSYRKNYRGNQRLVLDSPKTAKILFNRVKHLLPKTVTLLGDKSRGCKDENLKLDGLNSTIRFGKYNPNDEFGAHKDSGFTDVSDVYVTRKAMLTIMFYLNDFPSSEQAPTGRTRMLTLNKTPYKSEDVNCEVLDAVTPTAGKCIVFNQYSIYHDGENVGNCVEPKYIMRTDIMYRVSDDIACNDKSVKKVLQKVEKKEKKKEELSSDSEEDAPNVLLANLRFDN